MKAVDVVVATGGGAMVKSAYSSGRPSFGVGAGNVPVIIDRDVDMKDAVEKIVLGASFDNGIICSHEQFVLAPEEQYADVLNAFKATGKVWFTEDKTQIQKLRDVVFPGGHLNKDVVGKSPRQVGALAGIDVLESARIILLPADRGPSTRPRACARSVGRSSLQAFVPPPRKPLIEAPAFPRCTQTTATSGARRAADQPARRQPGEFIHKGLVDERLCAAPRRRLRIVGRKLDFREPRLQAPDECVAHRQGHHEQEDPDRRRDLGLTPAAPDQ
jgi:hypothetical protein